MFRDRDCVAYGNFTGSNAGYGSPAAALPITGNSSLKRAGSTDTNNNASDFSLSAPAPRNNAGASGTVTPPPAAPAGLAAVDLPNDKGGAINLTWTPSTTGGVTEQRLYRGTTSGSHPTLVATFNDNSTSAYTDTGRTDGTTYFYVVRAFDGTDESADSNEAFAQPVDNFVPTGLTAIDSPDDQGGAIDLTWTPSTSTEVTEQRIYRGTTAGSYSLVATTTTSTSAYTDTGLNNGTTYFYVVRSFDGTSESGDSIEASAAPVDNLAPQPPTGLTAVDRPDDTGGAINLTWTPSTSADVTEQRLYRRTTSGTYTTPLATSTTSTGAYIDTGLTDGTTYLYVLRAFDGTSESADSDEASAQPVDNFVPTGLTATDRLNDQGGAIVLAWTPSTSTDVTEQRLYRSTTSGGSYSLVATPTISTSAYTDAGLSNGVTYFYVVRSFDGTSESADSNEASAAPTDNLAPQPPTGLMAEDRPNDQGGAIDLTWAPSTSTDVTEQGLYRGTAPGSHPTLVATSTTSTSAYTDTGRTNGTTFYYVVLAFDGTSESADSNEASAAPIDNVAPQPPTGLAAADAPADQGGVIELAWTPSTSTDVTQQRLYRRTISTSYTTPLANFNDTTTSSHIDTGLTDGTTYYYVLRAFDGTSESADSNEAMAAPVDNLAPQPPTALTAADRPNDGGGVIDLAWTPSTSTDVIEQRLYRGTTSGTHPTLVATSTNSASAYTDTGLNATTTYYYAVRAFDGTSESANSNQASAVPLDDPPAAPTGLTAADQQTDEGGATDLTWTPSTSADVAEQRLYRRTTSGSYTSPVKIFFNSTTNAYTDTGLTDGAPYFYVVRAFDGTSESADSSEASAVPIDNLAPAAPTGLTAEDTLNDRGGAVDLSWSLSTSTDITQQRLYRGIASGSHPTLVATFSSTTSAYTDTGRTDGVVYYYVVTAFDGTTESAASNEASAVPVDDLALAIPGLSEWGLIALTGLLGGAILWRIRRAGSRRVGRITAG